MKNRRSYQLGCLHSLWKRNDLLELKIFFCFTIGLAVGVLQLCRFRGFHEHESYVQGNISDLFSAPVLLAIFSFSLFICIFIEDPIAEFTTGHQPLTFNRNLFGVSVCAIGLGEIIAWLISKPKL